MQNPFTFQTYIDAILTEVTLTEGQSVKYTWSYNSKTLKEKGLITFTLSEGTVHRLYQSVEIQEDYFLAYEVEGALPIQHLKETDPFSHDWTRSSPVTKVMGDCGEAIPIIFQK